MANSAQEYIDKLYNQSRGMAGQLHEQRKQSDDEVIQQINAAIDRATASSTNPYKTQMEQLPSQYQSLFDANAVQELVGRRQVQEAMANMGLTDSGLNRTQQTALSVQRGNADASVRLAQQQKTQELQDKISQLVENAAAQKQQQEASIRANTSDWYNTLLSNFYSTAQQQGTSLYNAEQERAAAAAEAERQRLIAAADAEAKAKQQDFENQLAIAKVLQDSGASSEEVNRYLQRAASGAGNGTLISDTANTTQFRAAMMTPGEFSRRSTTKAKYGNYDNYIKSFLTDWYNQNKLSNEEFAFLLNYYGL
jgi:hypothetical protein